MLLQKKLKNAFLKYIFKKKNKKKHILNWYFFLKKSFLKTHVKYMF